MSNSDKEFKEWWGKSLTGIKIYPNNEFVAKQVWNHLYEQLNVSKAQIKEKEDIIKSLEARVKDYESGHRGACFTCEPVGELNKKLEALLIEACELMRGQLDNNLMRTSIGIMRYVNKPEIKKLLNRGE